MFESLAPLIVRVAVALAAAMVFSAIIFVAVIPVIAIFAFSLGQAPLAPLVLIAAVVVAVVAAYMAVRWFAPATGIVPSAVTAGFFLGVLAARLVIKSDALNHPLLQTYGSPTVTILILGPFLGAFVGGLIRTRRSRAADSPRQV